MSNPTVSAIIPLYNAGQYIEETVTSVLSQTLESTEIIVVDDGSTDDGPERVRRLAARHPDRCRFLEHPGRVNRGQGPSRNLGVAAARGEYVAFLDADDTWLPGKLERQLEVFARFSEVVLCYSRMAYVGEGGSPQAHDGFATLGKGKAARPAMIFRELLLENTIPLSSVVARTEVVRRFGGFEEGPKYQYEDWLLFAEMAFFHPFYFDDAVLVNYRLHTDSFSVDRVKTGDHLRADRHFVAALFRFLRDHPKADPREVRRGLRRAVWYSLLRSHSWGGDREALNAFVEEMIRLFPSEVPALRAAQGLTSLVNPRWGKALRRIRRRIVGV